MEKKSSQRKNTPVDTTHVDNLVLMPRYPVPKKLEPADPHAFWKDQPVPKFALDLNFTNSGYLVETLEGVSKDPLPPPTGMTWAEFDVMPVNAAVSPPLRDLTEIYEFLRDNYVNGDPSVQFDYSPQFIAWAICPPGYSRTLHIGLRSQEGKLMGFISGAPCTIRVYGVTKKMVEINYLCIRKGERGEGIAPLLIEEVARRVRWCGIWQAIYTSVQVLPHSLATVRFYHRPLNIRKLIEVGFHNPREGLSLAAHEKIYALQPCSLTVQRAANDKVSKGANKDASKGAVDKVSKGAVDKVSKGAVDKVSKGAVDKVSNKVSVSTIVVRKITPKDIQGCARLLNKYLSQFHLAQEFTKAEFAHAFISPVVQSYVVTTDRVITGFISFYTIDHKSRDGTNVRVAYSYYNVAGKHSWTDLMLQALILAKETGHDVFNCLDAMDNSQFIPALKFTPGTGNMRFHLYNWNCPPTQAPGIGVILK
jgi:glycylpeptide N-tetradecanoyltransferase